jgi:hypothetical protein
MSLPREIAGVSQLSMALAWQRVQHVEQVRAPFLRDTPPFQLVSELTPLPSEVIFDRITMSAFAGTPLDIAMRDCGLNSFAIVGIALEVGIEPTVRHAKDLGYIPVVITDACGSRDKEAANRVLAGLQFTCALCHGVAILRYATLANGQPLAKGKTVTGFANAEEDFADNAVWSMNLLPRDKHVMPWRIEDELKKLGANYIQAGLWRGFAVRDGNLITGQQNFSGAETAQAVIRALGE